MSNCPPLSNNVSNTYIQTFESISSEIVLELSDPNIITPAVCAFLRANVGAINTLLYTSFQLDINMQLTPRIGIAEADIMKIFYYNRYYEKQSRSTLLNAAPNSIVSLADGKSKVQFETKASIAKAWKELLEESKKELEIRVDFYKRSQCYAMTTVGLPYNWPYAGGYGSSEWVLTPYNGY